MRTWATAPGKGVFLPALPYAPSDVMHKFTRCLVEARCLCQALGLVKGTWCFKQLFPCDAANSTCNLQGFCDEEKTGRDWSQTLNASGQRGHTMLPLTGR